MEAYQKVQELDWFQELDWSSGADWKMAAKILFTVAPQTQGVRDEKARLRSISARRPWRVLRGAALAAAAAVELCVMRRYLTSTLGAGLGGQWGREGPRPEINLLARLLDISTFINCSRVWSVGEDITMIVFSEDGEGNAGSRRMSAVSCDGGTTAHLMAWCRVAPRSQSRKATPSPGVEVVVHEGDDASVRRGDKPGDLFLFFFWDICVTSFLHDLRDA